MRTKGLPEKEEECVAWITIRLHATGEMTIAGTIADKRMARSMLDQAKDAINSQIKEKSEIVTPNRDVVVPLIPGLVPMGDIPRDQRGDD
jgi:hypothetical protein